MTEHSEIVWSPEEIAHILRLAGSGKLDTDRLMLVREVIAVVDGDETVIARTVSHDLKNIRAALADAGVDVHLPGDVDAMPDRAEAVLRAVEERRRHIVDFVEKRIGEMDAPDLFDEIVEMLVKEYGLARERAEDEALEILDAHLSEDAAWPASAPRSHEWITSRDGIERHLPRHRRMRYTKQASNPLGPVDELPGLQSRQDGRPTHGEE